MPGALAAIEGRGGEIRIEEDQRLGRHPAILDEAEAQRVDPRAPGEVRRRAADPRHRIGETSPVPVEAEPTRIAEQAQRPASRSRVAEAHIGGPGYRSEEGRDRKGEDG